MKNLADRHSSDVTLYDPKESAAKVHVTTVAEKAAIRAKDPHAIMAAIAAKIEAQRDFAKCVKAACPYVAGPGKGKRYATTDVPLDNYCRQFGFRTRTVQRWYPLLDEAILESTKEARGFKAFEMAGLAVSESTGDRHRSDDSYEWYTSAEIIASAHRVLGHIDLDPASTAKANKFVAATEYFTKEQDGLRQPWHGSVWLNPPYCQPEMAQFAQKMIDEYKAGNITGILLCNNATDTEFFHSLAYTSNTFCLTSGRVKFWGPHAADAGARQGQALFYFGPNDAAFIGEFSNHGLVLRVHE